MSNFIGGHARRTHGIVPVGSQCPAHRATGRPAAEIALPTPDGCTGAVHTRAWIQPRARPASLTWPVSTSTLGVDGWGRPFDVVAACRVLDADVLVIQESWHARRRRPRARRPAVADRLGYRWWPRSDGPRPPVRPSSRPHPPAGPAGGSLGAGLRSASMIERWRIKRARRARCGRPFRTGQLGGGRAVAGAAVDTTTVIPLGKLRRRLRPSGWSSAATSSSRAGTLAVFGTHMSHITHGSPLPSTGGSAGCSRQPTNAAVLAGDMNLWGPPVTSYLPGLAAGPATGRTWPAHRPHSQLDHVLVTPPVVRARGPRSARTRDPTTVPVVVTLALARDRDPDRRRGSVDSMTEPLAGFEPRQLHRRGRTRTSTGPVRGRRSS